MSDLSFLDSVHQIYQSHRLAWMREERRLVGGDAVLTELTKFDFEDDDTYAARLAWARWPGYPKTHTAMLAGHLQRQMPMPEFGELGDVRGRDQQDGNPSFAELFFYNCDGPASDGMQLPAFMDGVEQRALATGFRWLMVEMPTRAVLAEVQGIRGITTPTSGTLAPTTDADFLAGFRPFLVEDSPLAVPNWRYRNRVLCWAIRRIPVESEMDFDAVEGGLRPTAGRLGYHLLVRQGYEGLAPEFALGGWWKYDADKRPIDQGDWSDTDGAIPMWQHIGEPGMGTWERPSIGQSSTMELGQISADQMNAISEQRHNLRQAAKSINYWTGMRANEHEITRQQIKDGSIHVAVPPSQNSDGTFVVPELANSSSVALDSEAYKTVLELMVQSAKDAMVRQVTSTPDSSGASKEAGFAEATSPLLARIAATAEQSWNTMLYFVAKRFGVARPTASIVLPRDYVLRDVLAGIDQLLDTMEKAGVQSATLQRSLVERKADELDLLPEDDREAIQKEMQEGAGDRAKAELSQLRAQAVRAWLDADAPLEGAIVAAGLSDQEARDIYGDPAAIEAQAAQAAAARLQGMQQAPVAQPAAPAAPAAPAGQAVAA